mmetsp:Transcript_34456/g.50598  ORF Transcript_34456/g.50598 Transcript_34456/m.50598 type:complete len:556 (+) Transcript_34456:154-1821(+)|eukprot:CAMPEP_0195515812 /NCGR_PEP_ID=MMETSP0794_2-20130614/6745_1 /TAXON_ID=515487 /ORGANISM="Stephanopyxis turris, Strain CCMP 815" /LENGTH=555 /DNA_ID=CAMNT_0040644297 /DNA_START=116 /DNA_END=1783 /DNA_ORIENTATION=+
MTLHEIESAPELESFQSSHAFTLVCFSATWCGPCKQSKPTLEALATEYESDSSVNVVVGIVYEHNLGDDLQSYGVKAFPSYILWEGSKEVGRVEGPDFKAIRKMVVGSGCMQTFGPGSGQSLGGGNTATISAEDARNARLARFAAAAPAPAAPVPAASNQGKEEAAPQDAEMADATDTSNAAKPADGDAMEVESSETPEMVDPTATLDKEALKTLTGAMGFSTLRAQKGLLNGGGNVEGAVEWLLAHQDDANIDDPICLVAADKGKGAVGIAQSYKCNECGKILSNMANLELHANKTGHSDFEECTEAVKPLTPEEKAAKLVQIKALLKAKRAEREKQEKEEDVEREKRRRFMGQEMSKTKEQMEIEKRKRDAQMKKREKESFKRERERIRAELAKDKAERIANKGKLSSRLGADGYNPDGIQYDLDVDGEKKEMANDKKATTPKKTVSGMAKVEECIKKVSQYKAGGDGGKCLKILLAYVKNVVDKDEEKFRSINMDNKAYKSRIKPFLGAKALLLAVGFTVAKDADKLVLSPDADKALLAETKVKLEAAVAAY